MTFNSNYSHKTEPLKHQFEGIKYIEETDAVALFDEQGLGKSKMVIDALVNNIRDKIIDSVLVICKKTLMENWKEEIAFHSYLSSIVISGNVNNKFKLFQNRSDFYIVCYESVASVIDLLEILFDTYNLAIVLDESQKIKNPAAKITETILSIGSMAKKRIIITGTPIANNPEDIWSQYYFLDGGKTLGKDYQVFREEYGINYRSTNVSDYENRLDPLRESILNNSLRRTKDVLSLPDKEYHNVIIEMEGKQRELYDATKKQLLDELEQIINDPDSNITMSTIDNQLVKMLRLVQISSNPRLIDKEYDGAVSKFDKLDELVERIISQNEKCIIWSSFVSNIEELKIRYSRHRPAIIHGGIPIEQRNRHISKFKNDPTRKIMIANPSAAKEGLTLVSANNSIYLDRSFKMDDYLQSQDRIHRIGQTKKCHIYKLLCQETIDEYIDEILQKKEKVLKYTMGDINTIEYGDELTLTYLKKILG